MNTVQSQGLSIATDCLAFHAGIAALEAGEVAGHAMLRRAAASCRMAAPLACAFSGPHLQALELAPGALAQVRAVEYARPFNAPGLG